MAQYKVTVVHLPSGKSWSDIFEDDEFEVATKVYTECASSTSISWLKLGDTVLNTTIIRDCTLTFEEL